MSPPPAPSAKLLPGRLTGRFVQPPSVRFHDRGAYTAVHTEDRRDYWAGNLLQLEAPPGVGDLATMWRWWVDEFSEARGLEKAVFEWETAEPPGTAEATGPGLSPEVLAREGLSLEPSSVLTLGERRQLHPPAPGEIRTAASDQDWADVTELAVAETRSPSSPNEASFRRWQCAGYRVRAERGQGEWWGLWRGGALLASAGFYWQDGWGRFQEVLTRSGHRRQGLCSTLCGAILDRHEGHIAPERTVIVAEAGDDAERIYLSLGFRRTGAVYWLLGDPGPHRAGAAKP